MRDTIDMAREAGESIDKNWLERFADLVRADERKQIALDKKADNARELGLDYEPAPVQERNFCERCGKRVGGEGDIHTCTPPATQRPWVGLTDEERTEIRREHYARTLSLMDAVEAKLKDKNTP